jgi:hypothetical protein
MNKHILKRSLAQQLLVMGFVEATHTRWHKEAPHTFIDSSKPIDGIYHTHNLDITAITQLSFHKSVGDHGTILVIVMTRLVIGQQEYRVVWPTTCRLASRNKSSMNAYLKDMRVQFENHKFVQRQNLIVKALQTGPATPQIFSAMESLDIQKTKIQCGCKSQCQKLKKPELAFSLPV